VEGRPVSHAPQAPCEPQWLTQEEREAWLSLSAIMFQLPGQLENQLQRDSGMGFVEYMVLAMLSEAPERRLTMTELSSQTNTRLARLSRVVKRLEEDAYVERTTSETDRRVSICHLLPSGHDAVVAAAPGHVRQVRAAVFNRPQQAPGQPARRDRRSAARWQAFFDRRGAIGAGNGPQGLARSETGLARQGFSGRFPPAVK
jgi:DNA-binding MarR family transcriptional regulator